MQCMFEETKSEALRAVDVLETPGAAKGAERVRDLLQQIDGETQADRIPGESDDNGESLETVSVVNMLTVDPPVGYRE